LVQERVGTTLELIGTRKDFLNGTLAAQQLRDSTDKWHSIKLKSFCSTKEMVSKPSPPWLDLFYNHQEGLSKKRALYRKYLFY
jgi:hypothetical protein